MKSKTPDPLDLAIQYFPGWNKVKRRLDAGHSVLCHGPRRCGRRLFLRHYLESFQERSQNRCLNLHLRRLCSGPEVDSALLARTASEQLGWPDVPGGSLEEVIQTLRDNLEAHPGRTLVVLHGRAGQGTEALVFELAAAFCELVTYFDERQAGELTLLVLDDYSLYFFESWRNQELSPLDHLYSIPLKRPKEPELKRYLQRLTFRDMDPTDLAQKLLTVTGGHPGLLLELVETLVLSSEEERELLLEDMEAAMDDCRHLDELHSVLAANPQVLSRTALVYEKPLPLPPQTPEAQYLVHLGIVLRSGSNRWQLCPGVLAELVRELSRETVQVLGTHGSTASGDEEVPVTDDDFLIVHLSDLHVGPHFRFHLEHDFDGLKKAHVLLRDDLEQLGWADRVDALVVSGDFVENGHQADQFSRAREVLDAIRQTLGLDWSRVSVLAGNHDIDWTPDEFARKHQVTQVSRENYETFCRTLGKDIAPASLLSFPSRSGSHHLRILGLDSNLVESPAAGGIGFVGADTLEYAEQLLKDAPRPGDAQAILWLAVHHHLFPATSPMAREALEKRVSLFANASELLSQARRWRSELLLHGHEHQPSITVARRWSYPRRGEDPPFYPLISAGAGSFALRQHLGPIGRNHYYILHRRPNEILFHSRTLHPDGLVFTHHDRVRVPLP